MATTYYLFISQPCGCPLVCSNSIEAFHGTAGMVVSVKPTSGRPCDNTEWVGDWLFRMMLSAPELRPSGTYQSPIVYDPSITTMMLRRSASVAVRKKKSVARVEKIQLRRVPDRRESITVDLCAVATHARLDVAASQSACGKVSNKMEAAEWTDAEEDRLIQVARNFLTEMLNNRQSSQSRWIKINSLSRNLPSKCAPPYWKSCDRTCAYTRNRHRWSDRDRDRDRDACSTTFTTITQLYL